MALNDIVTVTVTQSAAAITTLGFGTPLVLSHKAAFLGRVKSYYDMDEVETDFAEVNGAERLAMGAIFAQTPAPSVVKMGKCLLPPTMRYKISAITPTSFHSTLYQLRVKGAAFDEELEFTSDANATDAEFASALVAALNGVSGKNYTASGATSPVSVTATNPGDYFSIEIYDRRLMTLLIDHADPGIATDLAAIRDADGDFISVIGTQMSDAMIDACGAWCNTNSKLYLFDTPNTKAVTTAEGTGDDAIDDAKAAGRRYVSGWFHPSPANFLAAAVNAVCLPLAPGSETWAYKQLSGVSAVALTPGERANLVAKYGNSYENVRGTPITFDGRTSNGSWIDLVRGILWAIDQIQVDFFNFVVKASSEGGKIGFDEAGRVALEGNFKASLKKLVTRGLVAEEGSKVTVIPLADVPAGDKANRIYPDTEIEAVVLGAVQKSTVRLIFTN